MPTVSWIIFLRWLGNFVFHLKALVANERGTRNVPETGGKYRNLASLTRVLDSNNFTFPVGSADSSATVFMLS